MPANRLGIVIVSLLFAGCVSPKSLVDRTGDSAFDNARVASSNESLNPADEAEGEARDAAETRTAKLGAISAPSPSLNRPPNPPHEMPGLSISASDQIRLARADVQSGKLEAAKARYQMVLQQDPQHVDAHHGLAVIADNARDFLTAEQHYKSALQVRPTDVGLLSDHGYSYLLQGKLDESVQILTRATELDPDHRQALNNLGLAFALKKDPERSFAAFRRADGDEAARARIAKLLPDQNPQPIASAVAAESATHPHIVPRTTLASGEAPFPAAHPDAAIIATESAPTRISADQVALEPMPQAVRGAAAIPDWPSRPQENTTSHPVSQPNEVVVGMPLTDREAALLGLNTGAFGPFPMIYQSQTAAAPESSTVAIAYQPSGSEPGPAPVRQASEPPQWPGSIPPSRDAATSTPTSAGTIASDASPQVDPLANFEAGMRRRAAEDYSSQRSFRTGATRTARQTTP